MAKMFIHLNGLRRMRERKNSIRLMHATVPATSTSTHKSRKRLTCRRRFGLIRLICGGAIDFTVVIVCQAHKIEMPLAIRMNG